MKRVITCLGLAFLLGSSAIAQQIDSMVVVPANPVYTDTVKILIYNMFPFSGCAGTTNWGQSGFTINAGALHCQGMLTTICYDVDTVVLLPPHAVGTYTCNFTLDAGFGGPPCTPGIVPVDFGTVMFNVDTILSGQPPTVSGSAQSATCNGQCDGTATASAADGVPPYTFLWDDPASQTDSTATGLCAGTYTVTVTDNIGDTVTTQVTIGEPPLLVASASLDTTICDGEMVTISATVSGGTGNSNETWDQGLPGNGPHTVTPTTTTCYTVYATDSQGCQSASDTVCIVVNPTYQTSDSVTINQGDSVFVGGDWQTTTGAYLDSFPSVDGCDSLVTTQLTVVTGIDAYHLANTLRVYPNPSSGTIQIVVSGMASARLGVLDVWGRSVLNMQLQAGTQEVDLSSLPNGIYVLRMAEYATRVVLSR